MKGGESSQSDGVRFRVREMGKELQWAGLHEKEAESGRRQVE